MLNEKELQRLEKFAKCIRLETLKSIKNLGFGHIGGCGSITDALAVLYGKHMKVDPKNPKMEDRDYLVCSKGHAGPAIYSCLALKGFFPVEELMNLNKNGTNLPSHCDKNLTIGIDMTTGSLGQGASSAAGIALANKIDGRDENGHVRNVSHDADIFKRHVGSAVKCGRHAGVGADDANVELRVGTRDKDRFGEFIVRE